MTTLANLDIPVRFNGPPDSANGGVTAGMLARRFKAEESVTVTLRLPPPLGVPIRVEHDQHRLRALTGLDLVADATVLDSSAAHELRPVEPVGYAEAVEAATRYDGLHEHPFPTCFVCGTERPHHDGLELWAGAIDPAAPRRVATPFVPRADVGLEGRVLVWAALDCPGGWSIGLVGRRAVLGRMTARVEATPLPGERCVVVAECDRWDGRKAFSRSSLYGESGRLLGTASQIWIELRG